MNKQVDDKYYISKIEALEKDVEMKVIAMRAAIKQGINLDKDLINANADVKNIRKEKVLNNLKQYSLPETKKYLETISNELTDISIGVKIEMASDKISSTDYCRLRKVMHRLAEAENKIRNYNILEFGKHVDSIIKCIKSASLIMVDYKPELDAKRRKRKKQYTVTKPANYVPFPMR